jgi:hypothetical protein
MADTGSADAYSMGVAAGSYKCGGKVRKPKRKKETRKSKDRKKERV